MQNIINNNYAVMKTFDDHFDGLLKGYLSKDEATTINQNHKPSRYLNSSKIIEKVAIIGIVNMNGGFAYIFNKAHNSADTDKVITCGKYEDLMNCYVYSSISVNEKYTDSLVEEYHERGGKIYDYHEYKDLFLRPEQKKRCRNYRNSIIDQVLKHGFREVGKLKWSNGDIIIRQIDHTTSRIKYEYNKQPLDLNYQLDRKILLNSLFSKTCEYVNRLDEHKFCVRNTGKSSYLFSAFTIEFNIKDS
jgi:hypothetical protein